MGMSVPMAIIALISWAKHPYKNRKTEVEIANLTSTDYWVALGLAVAITCLFYFVLRWLGTANLLISTISVGTSFLAAYFSFKRSPQYALGYAINDVVLIILWILAAIQNISYLSVVICFLVFLLNDLYAFFSWKTRHRQQISYQPCVQ